MKNALSAGQQTLGAAAAVNHQRMGTPPNSGSPREHGSASGREADQTAALRQSDLFAEASMRLKLNPTKRAMVYEVFTNANFCFATKQEERLPTLYFSCGGPEKLNTASMSGRLRQQHPHGPLVEVTKSGRLHLFIDDLNTAQKIERALKSNHNQETLDNAVQRSSSTPTPGAYHVEVLLNEPGSTKVIGQVHLSGGRVDTSIQLPAEIKPTDIANDILRQNGGLIVRIPLPLSNK